jgi:hypothetical protein
MEQEDGFRAQDSKGNIILPPTLCRVSTHKSERQRQVSRLGDGWIPFSLVFPNHFIRFFISGVEDLFRAKDQILKVENFGVRSRLISWKAFDDENFGIGCQMDSIDEQTFTIQPFNVVILDLVTKGRQSSFLS